MADATFRDFVLDACDAPALAAFWSVLMEREHGDAGAPDRVIEPVAGGTPAERIWVNQVPEPRTGKTRVHPDLRLPAADPAPLLAAGATLVSEPHGDQHWWVLTDPEGNHFCAMPPAPPEWNAAVDRPTPFELVVDSADPTSIAAWWAERVGGEPAQARGCTYVRGVGGFPWYAWVFNPVPEPKTVKNRWHWDVTLVDPRPDAFLAAGATLLAEPTSEIRWWVLADPEGNEFCAFPPG
jgi:hypothetical protein